MKKRTLAAVSLLAALGLAATVGLPADASSPTLRLSYAIPNTPGVDLPSNVRLNREWVRLKNSSSTSSYTLTNWTIRDKTGYAYKFGTFTLEPGASVTLHTGSGANTSTDRYWGKRWYVWNNGGDVAYLRNSSGTTKDTCAWGRVGDGHKVTC